MRLASLSSTVLMIQGGFREMGEWFIAGDLGEVRCPCPTFSARLWRDSLTFFLIRSVRLWVESREQGRRCPAFTELASVRSPAGGSHTPAWWNFCDGGSAAWREVRGRGSWSRRGQMEATDWGPWEDHKEVPCAGQSVAAGKEEGEQRGKAGSWRTKWALIRG